MQGGAGLYEPRGGVEWAGTGRVRNLMDRNGPANGAVLGGACEGSGEWWVGPGQEPSSFPVRPNKGGVGWGTAGGGWGLSFVDGGQEKEVGAGCRGHRRASSSEFRKAVRCHHGNCRAGTSLKKKKDKFDDFICYLYTLHREEKWGPWSAGGGYAGRHGGPHRDNDMDQSVRLVMTVPCSLRVPLLLLMLVYPHHAFQNLL